MKYEFYDKLKGIMGEIPILFDEPMKKHTTFRIGGNADMFVAPKLSQIPQIIALAKEYEVPVTIVGNGSNLLIGDKGIRGLVVCFSKLAEELVIDGTHMTIGAGTLLSKAASEAAKKGLSGLEFAAGIPGTLGGAMVMNAGAYGGEMKDVVVSAKVLTQEGEILDLDVKDLDLLSIFSYSATTFHTVPFEIVSYLYLFLLWRFASYIRSVAEIAAFNDSTFPCIGILIYVSAISAILSLNPFPSFPIKNPQADV